MRVAYLDCFAGIAGDMFLGALLNAGVPADVLHSAVAALDINASLEIETVSRSGISSTKVHVLENGELAERPLHKHKPGEDHEHEHGPTHTHGRSLTEIRALIANSPLPDAVKRSAIQTFDLLGTSEAKIHNVSLDQIHFHEVGAVDAIVDIVATCAGIHHLQIDAWYSSPINVGGGMVVCAHGTFPVPAPATADLLRNVPTYSAHIQKELVTPTGAALLRMLAPTFGQQPAMQVEHIGYGAGTRNPKDFPNVLRLSIGERLTPVTPNAPQLTSTAHHPQTTHNVETVTVLETALDDASPQLIAFVAEQALAQGALDVMLTPVIMKKGRPGTLLTVLCRPADSDTFTQLLLRETPTLGLRVREEQRAFLHREHTTVETTYGPIRIKLGRDSDQQRNATPEYEDCKAAALNTNTPLKQVQQAAIAALFSRA